MVTTIGDSRTSNSTNDTEDKDAGVAEDGDKEDTQATEDEDT